MSNRFLIVYSNGKRTKVSSDCEDAAALANQMFGRTLDELVELEASVTQLESGDDLWDLPDGDLPLMRDPVEAELQARVAAELLPKEHQIDHIIDEPELPKPKKGH